MQFVIVGFCSLVLPVVDFSISRSTTWQQGKPGLAVKLLRKCQSTVNEINAFYVLSICIAAVVRYTQMPPVFEIFFIGNLLYVQSFIVFTDLLSRYWDSRFNGIRIGPSRSVYDIANGITGLVTNYTISVRNDAFPVLFETCKSCSSLYHYIDMSPFFAPTENAASSARSWGIGFGIGLAIFVAGGLLASFVKSVRKFLFPKWFRKHFFHITTLLYALAFIALFALLARRLALVRDLMQTPNQTEAEDQEDGDDWGYGQTTAVLLWTPVLRTFVKTAWGECSHL